MLGAIMAMMTVEASAHEFWIEPQHWISPPDQKLSIALRIGSDFSGFQQVYMPAKFTRFHLVSPQHVTDIKGRLGDRPAGRIHPVQSGLHLLQHITTDEFIKYSDLGTFISFTLEKGIADAEGWHIRRALPEAGFVEQYRRYAKALVAIGEGQGQDRTLGMAVEITALDNPYHLKGDQLRLRLDRDGAAWPHVQVTVFARPLDHPAGPAIHHTYRSDDQGRVTITVPKGSVYLVDAVSLDDIDPATSKYGAVWQTRWASLTFARPHP